MTYTITDPCLDTKDKSCVEVCPVDCIHEDEAAGDRMLYIDPEECIDCGACEPVCPVTAIFAEDDRKRSRSTRRLTPSGSRTRRPRAPGSTS